MADTSGLSPYMFPLEGGLVLNKSNFAIQPGMAYELENFEPDTSGGYRRINGHVQWGLDVPFTYVNTEPVLMTAFYLGEVIAARGESVYRSSDGSSELTVDITDSDTTIIVRDTEGFSETGTLALGSPLTYGVEYVTYTGKNNTEFTGCTRGVLGSIAKEHTAKTEVLQAWTEIESGRVGAKKYSFVRGALVGTLKLIYCDGVNPISMWDGSTVKQITGPLAPVDPKFLTDFKNAGFYAGMSSNPQEVIYTSPASVDGFDPALGAGSFVIDEPVTGMTVFRDTLYIFSANRIYRLTGSSQADYVLSPITRDIGCRNGWTIKEFAGDIIFLGPDGLRTIAGTEKIGDVELGTISKPVQQLFLNNAQVSEFEALVVPDKTQYRLFFSKSNVIDNSTTGVICSRKQEGYEFSTTKGIKPYSSDTESYRGEYFVMMGTFDGKIYRAEQGSTFDGEEIIGRYRSPDITAGDPGIRKAFQRVIINYAPEGEMETDLFLRYDYEDSQTPRPAPYPFDSTQVVALYGLSIYGQDTYGGQTDPLVRQPVEGSGFSVALRVIDRGLSLPYSLKGFQLEFTTAARR